MTKSVTLVELVIALGISVLVIGASLGILLTGRISVFSNEAAVQATENARNAINAISKELCLSRPTAVFLSDQIGTTPNLANQDCSVVNFRIPVGVYDNNLQLDSDFRLQWGSEDTVGAFIAYSVDVDSNLIRSIYMQADGADAVSTVVSPNITGLAISRDSIDSNVIDISVDAQGLSERWERNQTLSSSIRLRN